MGVVSLTGKDTITIRQGSQSRTLVDFADGDIATLTFPNKSFEPKVGRDGNVLYNYNYSGEIVEMILRVVLGSPDDAYLNGLRKAVKQDPPASQFISCNMVKRTGDGQGNVTNVDYSVGAGLINQGVDSGSNVEGATDFNVAVYRFTFANNSRDLG